MFLLKLYLLQWLFIIMDIANCNVIIRPVTKKSCCCVAKPVAITANRLKFGSRLGVGRFLAKVQRIEMMAQVNLIVYSAFLVVGTLRPNFLSLNLLPWSALPVDAAF